MASWRCCKSCTCKLRTTVTELRQFISGLGTFRISSTTSVSMVDGHTGSTCTGDPTRRRHCHTWHLILRRATLNRVVGTHLLAYVSGAQSPGTTISHGQYANQIVSGYGNRVPQIYISPTCEQPSTVLDSLQGRLPCSVSCVKRMLKILPIGLCDFGLVFEGVLPPSHGPRPKAYSNAKRPQPIVGPVPWTGNDRSPFGSRYLRL